MVQLPAHMSREIDIGCLDNGICLPLIIELMRHNMAFWLFLTLVSKRWKNIYEHCKLSYGRVQRTVSEAHMFSGPMASRAALLGFWSIYRWSLENGKAGILHSRLTAQLVELKEYDLLDLTLKSGAVLDVAVWGPERFMERGEAGMSGNVIVRFYMSNKLKAVLRKHRLKMPQRIFEKLIGICPGNYAVSVSEFFPPPYKISKDLPAHLETAKLLHRMDFVLDFPPCVRVPDYESADYVNWVHSINMCGAKGCRSLLNFCLLKDWREKMKKSLKIAL